LPPTPPPPFSYSVCYGSDTVGLGIEYVQDVDFGRQLFMNNYPIRFSLSLNGVTQALEDAATMCRWWPNAPGDAYANMDTASGSAAPYIIVDNSDSGVVSTGSWQAQSDSTSTYHVGSDYLSYVPSVQSGNSDVRFPVPVECNGIQCLVYVLTNPLASATSAAIVIQTSTGLAGSLVDMTPVGGVSTWKEVNIYTFPSDGTGYVEIRANDGYNGVMVADAVAFSVRAGTGSVITNPTTPSAQTCDGIL